MNIEQIANFSNDPEIKRQQAAQEFEGYFIHQLLKEMRKTIPKSDLMGENTFANELYNDMLDQQIASSIAKHGGFGLAKSLLQRSLPPGQATNAYRSSQQFFSKEG